MSHEEHKYGCKQNRVKEAAQWGEEGYNSRSYNVLRPLKSKSIVLGFLLGKLTGCEDDFAQLV